MWDGTEIHLGRRTQRALANTTTTSYQYDGVSRLTLLNFNLGTQGQSVAFGNYSPAGEIGSRTSNNDLYSWTSGANGTNGYATNGLNQVTSVGSVSLSHDARGNITSVGGTSYAYTETNLMTAAGSTTLAYDPLDRLYRLNAGSGADRTFGYDGDHMVTEFDAASGAIQARYIFGPGDDEPIVWYPGSGTAARYFMEQDERGSVARITDGSGGLYAIDSYDEYGNPGAGTSSRFQYTGQMALAGTANLLYYKARVYNPALGRFMQTDPIGYAGGMNLYNYVGSDPINLTDPGGLDAQCGFGKRAVYKDRQDTTAPSDGSILVTGHFLCEPDPTVQPVRPPVILPVAPPPPDQPDQTGAGATMMQGPTHIRIDTSCSGVINSLTPDVQAAALSALNEAIANDSEFGFFVSPSIFGGNAIGPAFSDGSQGTISGGTISRNRPSFPFSLASGNYGPSLMIHTHQTSFTASPVDVPDQGVADQQGVTVAAIDRLGNVTCSK